MLLLYSNVQSRVPFVTTTRVPRKYKECEALRKERPQFPQLYEDCRQNYYKLIDFVNSTCGGIRSSIEKGCDQDFALCVAAASIDVWMCMYLNVAPDPTSVNPVGRLEISPGFSLMRRVPREGTS